MLAPLRSGAFATLFGGYAVSALGDGMALVAVSWLAVVLAGGHDAAILVGAAVAAYTLPGVAGWLVLGRRLAHWDPRRLVLAEAALRAVCLGAIALLSTLGVLTPGLYVGLLAVSSLFGLLGVSGELAAVVELLPAAEQLAGNSLVTLASFAATVAGPALAGGLITLDGPGLALGADAASFAVLVAAAAASRRLRPPPVTPAGAVQGPRGALRSLTRQPSVLAATALCVVFFGVYGPVEVALPVYVSSVLHAGAGTLGGYWTLFSAGAVAGALGASQVERLGIWRVMIAVVAGWGACLVPFGFTDSTLGGFVALGVGGLVYGPFLPLKNALIQRAGPAGSISALAAASAAFTVPAAPIGTALGGPLVAALGPQRTLLASGLTTIGAAGVAAVLLLTCRRRHNAADEAPATVRP